MFTLKSARYSFRRAILLSLASGVKGEKSSWECTGVGEGGRGSDS